MRRPFFVAGTFLSRRGVPRAAPGLRAREKERPGRFFRRRGPGRWMLAGAALGLVLLASVWHLFPYGPARLEHYPASTYLLDRDGRPLRMLLGPGDLRSNPVALEETGEWAWKALVAVEDKRFFSHPGLDGLAIGRAAAQNVLNRRVISGASTLSSQVIRMTEPRPRTLPTKVVEGFRALQMDAHYAKGDILAQYLNRAPMGGNLEGVAAASRAYFGKDPIDLNLPEAALLMGLPQSPTRYRPTRYPDRAGKRRHAVLRRMLACGYITPDQFRDADRTPVEITGHPAPFYAPHFCELARRSLNDAPRSAEAPHRLRTTLDANLQRIAEDALGEGAGRRREQGVSGGAVVILEVATGAIRALVGSPDFSADDGQVNGATALRSPGSTLKPFVYALAIDQGRCTPGTVIADAPMAFVDYRPENFDRTFAGEVTVRQALVDSLNIPALALTQAVGLPCFLDGLHELGLTSIDQPAASYGLSLALGTAEVRLLDLAAAYAALARGGHWRHFTIWENEPPSCSARQVFSAAAAFMVADMLRGESRLMDVCGHSADVRVPPVAWKTGTSSGRRDAWTLAFNPEYVVGVWIGNPSGRDADILTGATVAAPVAYDIFRGLYPDGDGPWFERPPRVRVEEVCPLSGKLPGHDCRVTVDDQRIPGVSDPALCDAHGSRNTRAPAPRITAPVDGTRYRMAPGLPTAHQSIALSAQSNAPGELHWFVDGFHVGTASADSPVIWPLAPGSHTLACADAGGRADSVRIQVTR